MAADCRTKSRELHRADTALIEHFDPCRDEYAKSVVQIHAGSDLNVLAYSPATVANAVGNAVLPTIQTFTLGVTVEMVPIVNAAGDGVALSIKAQESHLLDIQNGAPEIARRDEETSVFLHDDQMVVLGGLRIDSTNRDNEKVPGLGDLPLIGGIFRYKSTQTQHSELVMLLRANVISIDGSGLCDQTRPDSTQPIDCAQNLNRKLPTPEIAPTPRPGR